MYFRLAQHLLLVLFVSVFCSTQCIHSRKYGVLPKFRIHTSQARSAWSIIICRPGFFVQVFMHHTLVVLEIYEGSYNLQKLWLVHSQTVLSNSILDHMPECACRTITIKPGFPIDLWVRDPPSLYVSKLILGSDNVTKQVYQ